MIEYVFESGKFGEKLVLQGHWNDRIAGYMEARSCDELEINYARGFRGADIEFLARLPFLRSLVLITNDVKDISPIHHLTSLRAIDIGSRGEKGEVDFSRFPYLEDCGLEWRPRAKSLFQCISLRRLWLNKYNGRDCSAFVQLKNLRELHIASAPVQTIAELSALGQLRELGLYYLRKLDSLVGVESIRHLDRLHVEGCRLVGSFNPVRELQCLSQLTFAQGGYVESLAPITGLPALEWLLFWGSTNIVDGDLSPILSLPRLERVSFKNRAHYSHRCEDFPQCPR